MIDVGFVSFKNYRVSVAYGWTVATAIAVTSATNLAINIDTNPSSLLRGAGVQAVEILTEAGDYLLTEAGDNLIMG